MLLWIVMAFLTAAAALSVLVPLYRGRADAPHVNPDMAIYKDQLGELDRDVSRGLIGENEAGAARTEIARRLLRADESARNAETPAGEGARRWAALVAIVAIPVLAVTLYLFLGSPDRPDQPLMARVNAPPDQQDIAALIARVETHLAAHPEDGRGWELLGPVYLRLGRMEEAQAAFANALRILGATSEREANLGEAMVRANDGIVSAEARAAFERAAALDKESLRPRFYLALALGQDGKKDEAIAAWRSLLSEAPAAGAPWVDVARQAIAELEGIPVADAAGPTTEQVDAAAKMTPEDRLAMIGGMVDSLSAKLESAPNDPDGWAKLIRSYMVLGRADDARTALARARTALAPDAKGLAIVEAEAKSRGLSE